MMLRQFTIDEQYICDVAVREEHDFIKDRNNPTPDDLFKIIKGYDKSYSLYHKDHDEFTKLREQLGELGYISIQRGWWNGDRVLKGFKLNEFNFKKGDKFCSAGAMKGSISFARSRKRKHIGF